MNVKAFAIAYAFFVAIMWFGMAVGGIFAGFLVPDMPNNQLVASALTFIVALLPAYMLLMKFGDRVEA